jgi:hypothetical protein
MLKTESTNLQQNFTTIKVKKKLSETKKKASNFATYLIKIWRKSDIPRSQDWIFLMESIQEWRNEEHDEKKWYHNWGRVKGNGRRKQRRKWMKKTSEAIKDKKGFVVSK